MAFFFQMAAAGIARCRRTLFVRKISACVAPCQRAKEKQISCTHFLSGSYVRLAKSSVLSAHMGVDGEPREKKIKSMTHKNPAIFVELRIPYCSEPKSR
jgi:hypothetical protein